MIPFQYILKRIEDGQVKITDLDVDPHIPIGPHQEFRLLDALRYLIKGVQGFFAELPQIDRRLLLSAQYNMTPDSLGYLENDSQSTTYDRTVAAGGR